MRLNNNKLETYEKTVLKILEFTEKYSGDCLFLINYTPKELFNFVKDLEYKPDPVGIEFLSRPEFSIFKKNLPRDCDDKTLIVTCWAKLKNIPFKVCVSGRRNKPHHIYPILFIDNKWIIFDATYSNGEIGKKFFKENFCKIYEKIN